MKRILVIDDDPAILDNVLDLLTAEGFEAAGAPNGKTGVAAALSMVPDLVVCDIGMPVMDGYAALEAIRNYPETSAVPFIFLTARDDRRSMRRGMELGADDFLTKPFSRSDLLKAIRGLLQRHQSILGRTGEARPDTEGPVIVSSALREVYDQALRISRSDLSLLLLGETGVGKDVLAHAVHKASPRAGSPFIPLNCAALADSLLESELFGHEKGAFTGATTRRQGLFESANGGTVFLDEIGDVPPAVQVKLLRVLQDRRVMRVGGREYMDVDVRFVSATNKLLEKDMAEGRFRSDLFYRLGAVVLTVPPLRDRRADIAPLAQRFARGMSRRMGRPDVRLSAPTLEALEAWHWPGNVRELRNVVERCVALTDSDIVQPPALPPQLTRGGRTALPDMVRDQQRALERQRIVDALEASGGNQTQAARVLGISRRTLINRLDEFGLPRPRK
jgi:two-component system, NtrC family, response regulator AtoC